jgi:tetratricopeptide (TPR) repeat protein
VRKCVFLICFLLAASCLFADSSAPDDAAVNHYANGVNFYNSNNFNSAINEFTQAIQISPEYADAYIGRGNSYDNKGDVEMALHDYLEASKLDKKFAVFAYGYECVERYEDFDEGILYLTESISLGINTVIAYCIIGNAYIGKEEYDNAIQYYNQVIETNPNFFQAYFSRGSAYFMKGDLSAAIEDTEKALLLCPDYIQSFYLLGLYYYLNGDAKKSDEMFDIYRSITSENKV